MDEGDSGLRYRGYGIGDLADWSSFEEVAHLLLVGRLPTSTELDTFSDLVVRNRPLPDSVVRFLETLRPGLHQMDVLRSGMSLLGLTDPDAQDGSPEGNLRKSIRLLGQVPLSSPSVTGYWQADNLRRVTTPADMRNICCVSSSDTKGRGRHRHDPSLECVVDPLRRA